MSYMEYNKGKLFPTTMGYDELFNYLGGVLDNISDGYSREEWCRDNCYNSNFEVIDGKIYKVVWEVKGGDELPELLDLTRHSDGTIEFETYHYNGGAHWTEVVEGAL